MRWWYTRNLVEFSLDHIEKSPNQKRAEMISLEPELTSGSLVATFCEASSFFQIFDAALDEVAHDLDYWRDCPPR